MQEKEIDINTPMGAIFSLDSIYRYALWRVWSKVKPLLLFVGLNPSKASATVNDPTIIRMMIRASNAGFGGLLAANLYAYVSTDPNALLEFNQAIGPLTDEYIDLMLDMAEGKALCGWGSFPAVKVRDVEVVKMIREPYCLGVNADGQPKHPLYIRYDTPMVKYITR